MELFEDGSRVADLSTKKERGGESRIEQEKNTRLKFSGVFWACLVGVVAVVVLGNRSDDPRWSGLNYAWVSAPSFEFLINFIPQKQRIIVFYCYSHPTREQIFVGVCALIDFTTEQ